MSTRVLVCLSMMAVACGGGSTTKKEDTTNGNSSISKADWMLRHFVRVAALEKAVIDERLDEAHQHAQALTAVRTADPEEWTTYSGYLRRAAASVVKAKTMKDAANATAVVVAQCGRCHKALGVEPDTTRVGDPPPDATLDQKMKRHQWATDVLRSAIVFSSKELWAKGAKALVEAPLHASEIDGGDPGTEIAEAIRNLRALAKIATTAPLDQWPGTYGAILRTCVKCHKKAR
jgi:hypothetical protein